MDATSGGGAAAPYEPPQRLGSGSVVLDPPEPTPVAGAEAESRKLPSSQYKGVVPQPNGRWGAQIYEKHQRVWLGTFNGEAEAARAYDAAVQRFRGRDAATNFRPLSPESPVDAAELRFLFSRSKAEVVDMLRKHTYHDELLQSRRRHAGAAAAYAAGSAPPCFRAFAGVETPAREQLFDKVVTPSDVGKLNRLVIPKQHAERHFPLQTPGVLLHFEEASGRAWRFRYSYWNSSQSYVLTKGWSRFVKEKRLRAGDVVTFQRSTGPDRQLYIGWRPRLPAAAACTPQPPAARDARPEASLRLFGVDITKTDEAGGKRKPELVELQLFSGQLLCKRQCTDQLL